MRKAAEHQQRGPETWLTGTAAAGNGQILASVRLAENTDAGERQNARGAAQRWHTKHTSPGKTHAVLLPVGTPSTLRQGKCSRCCSKMAHQAHFDGESARGAVPSWHTKRTSTGKVLAVLLQGGTPSTLHRAERTRCCSKVAHQAHFTGENARGAAPRWHTKRTSPGKTHAVLLSDGTPSTLWQKWPSH